MINLIKKIFSCLIITLVITQSAQAEMDPKIKAMSTMAIYGTVGGALLGTAALAFDADGRSVAVGASLGLYMGLIFGGYVIGTHYIKKNRMNQPIQEPNYYPDSQDSPYEDTSSGEGYSSGMTIREFQKDYKEAHVNPARKDLMRESFKPGRTYYMNLFQYQF